MSDKPWDGGGIDYRYPHKTPYAIRFQSETLIVLEDINHDDAASILDSADWVIVSLRIYRGLLKERIVFMDLFDGMFDLEHDGEELVHVKRLPKSQIDFVNRVIGRPSVEDTT